MVMRSPARELAKMGFMVPGDAQTILETGENCGHRSLWKLDRVGLNRYNKPTLSCVGSSICHKTSVLAGEIAVPYTCNPL